MHPPKLSESSWDFNPLQLDAYLLHLAGMQPQCTVTALENIFSSSNTLLVKKGIAITPEIAQGIMQFTLLKPIEESIKLSSEINEAKLLEDLIAIMKQDDILSAVNQHIDFISLLKIFCTLIVQSDMLRQKLTVMSQVTPDLYERSLYCAWISICIAKEMRLSQDDIAVIFVAAISHDIGMLHIDKEILYKQTAISAEDWMQIQRHVVIGRRLIRSMKNIPYLVAQAVYEHHEQSDGTGYPLGKLENELSLFGQIINLADAIIAIHFNYEKNNRRSWRDIIPLIHMNGQAYMTRANEVLLAIIRRADLPQKNVVQGDITPEFIDDLIRKNEQLKLWFVDMRESLLSIGFRHGDRRLHALQNVMLHLATSAEGSGIFNATNRELLLSPDSAPIDLSHQSEKMHLMQQEIIFHLQRLSRMTQLYLDSGECKNNDIKSVLTRSLFSTQKYLP